MEKRKISGMDIQIVAAVLICVFTATLLDHFGLNFSYGEMKMEVIQKMTAAIACLLCVQDTFEISRKSGKNRLLITAIGGSVGIFAVWLDMQLQNEWLMVGLTGGGILLTLFLCKMAKVPYINARIGGVTFILVFCTLSDTARMWYAMFRFVSTLYGVLVVILVTWIAQMIHNKMQ